MVASAAVKSITAVGVEVNFLIDRDGGNPTHNGHF